MLRRIALLAGLIFVVSLTTQAQDTYKVEVFGGYSYLRFDNSPSFNQNGWEVSGQYKFAPWLGALADFFGAIMVTARTRLTFCSGPKYRGRRASRHLGTY
jgi:hypothetical protein